MNPELIRETFELGNDTREQGCPLAAVHALRPLGIVGAGLSDAGRGYRMARPASSQAHLLVCHGGEGRVLIDGRWVRCGEGQAYVSPARRPMAFETVAGRRWKFAWFYFTADDRAAPPPGLLRADRSTLIRADPRPVLSAIRGTYLEAVGAARRPLLQLWSSLIHAYTLDIAAQSATRPIDPLWQLWEQVEARPAEPWSVERLAGLAGMSAESLRTLCRRHVGQSPMRHVTFLRMRGADTLLRSTSAKLSVIAHTVGYTNVFAFSTAYHRCFGVPPSTQRLRSDPVAALPENGSR